MGRGAATAAGTAAGRAAPVAVASFEAWKVCAIAALLWLLSMTPVPKKQEVRDGAERKARSKTTGERGGAEIESCSTWQVEQLSILAHFRASFSFSSVSNLLSFWYWNAATSLKARSLNWHSFHVRESL